MANTYSIGIKTAAAGEYSDLWDIYGVRLLRGAYEALLTPSGMKNYVNNASRLEHGTRYIATDGKMKDRQVNLRAIMQGEDYDDYLAKYEALLTLLMSGEIWLRVPRLKRVFKLVYTGISDFKFYDRKQATFTLEFVEPDPTATETITD